MLKLITAVGFVFQSLIFPVAKGDQLKLSGYIRSQSSVNFYEISRTVNSRRLFIEHRRNSMNLDSEKFEIEGLEQKGLEGKITQILSENRTIERQILLDIVTSNAGVIKPIILKISAN